MPAPILFCRVCAESSRKNTFDTPTIRKSPQELVIIGDGLNVISRLPGELA